MNTKMSVSRSAQAIGIAMAIVLLTTALQALVAGETAYATGNSVNFNVLGGWNGTYGNYGGNQSAEWAANNITSYRNGTGDVPFSAGFQEVCADSDVNILDQYQYLAFTLGQLSLTGAFDGPTVNPAWGPSPACTRAGVAVFGWSNAGTWAAAQTGPYANDPGTYNGGYRDGTSRRYLCVHPTLDTPFGTVLYKACTTHLDNTDDNRANIELADANTAFQAFSSYTRTTFTGDFNLSPQCNIYMQCGGTYPYTPQLDVWTFSWSSNHFESAPGGYNLAYKSFSSEGTATQKLDYVGRSNHFGILQAPSYFRPPCCLAFASNKRLSDHYLVRGFIG